MSNNIKFLLLNITLLAGMYCNCEYSRCAGCCKNCCGKEDLYFKIEGGAINDNKLGCFGEDWFEEYQNKKNGNNEDTILLYKLTEQKNKQEEEAGTLVYSPKSKELQYRNGGDLPASLKDSDNKWAIFKVTTLKEDNNKKQKGESHIFYCSDVSSIDNNGLFELVRCWSIEILAANTKKVKDFSFMFKKTKSSLEQDTKKQNKSGFIGLEKLDVSSAKFLMQMFKNALFKQKTISSLRRWRLRNNASISKMFYVDINNFVCKNVPDFRVLDKWIEKNNVYLEYSRGHKYSIFFKGYDNYKKNDKLLPKWYENNIKKS